MAKFDKSMFEYVVDETLRLQRKNKVWDFFGASIGIGKFIDTVKSLSGYLQSLGICKGDNVILCLGNIPNAIVSFYAINNTGAVANLVHPLIPSEGLRRMSEEMDTKAFILFDEFYEKYDWLKNSDKPVILCSVSDFLPRAFKIPYNLYIRKKVKNIKYNSKVVKFKDAINKFAPEKVEIKGDDIAVYMHSGGTTGVSKTVMLSNDAFNHLADNVIDLIGGGVDDSEGMLMVLPLFHNFGLGICMHTVISAGGQAVMMPKFKPKSACRLVKRARVTYMAGVPNMYAKMVACGKFKGKYLRKIKNCYCGGEKLSDAVKKSFEEAMATSGNPIKLCAGYGLTEGGICCVNTMDIHREGTLGKPVKNNEFAIVDDNNNFVEPMQKGMIVLTCNSMMTGYYNSPELDKEVFFYGKDGKKWLRTGDIGYMDEDGYVYFVDRLKRMVKISGVNVFPQEVEDCVNKFDGIVRSCLVSYVENGKTFLKLYIELEDGIEGNESYIGKLRAYIAENLLKYNMPRVIEVAKSLPLTQIGKVDFKILQNLEDGKRDL
ncbi:MAG: acyl--CoA ligase [Clostridia bacterium]|nr:acyl--CoA ligase [Clostridia bacterium]